MFRWLTNIFVGLKNKRMYNGEYKAVTGHLIWVSGMTKIPSYFLTWLVIPVDNRAPLELTILKTGVITENEVILHGFGRNELEAWANFSAEGY